MVERGQIHHPMQVFLDTKRFIRSESRPAGGGNKDFFAGNNSGFARHKARLQQAIRDVASAMEHDGQAANFLMVQMREDGLAKSYRPLNALFKPQNGFALAGGGRPGEMYFQCTPQGLHRLERTIEERAELTPRTVYNDKTQRDEERVSAYRSEVGAIDKIGLPTPADRIGFSARDAVDWLASPGVIGGYIVEFFRPDLSVEGETVLRTLNAFRSRLEALEGGLTALPLAIRETSTSSGTLSSVAVQLMRGTEEKHIALSLQDEEQFDETTTFSRHVARVDVPTPDFSIERHQALLDLLANEPLVRSVQLPPIIDINPAGGGAEETLAEIAPPVPEQSYPVVGIIDGGIASLDSISPWRAGTANTIDPDDRDEYHGTFIAGLVAGARQLNPHIEAELEATGCQFYDLDILPRQGLLGAYYASLPEFIDQLDVLIERAKAEANARVFNLSLGMPRVRSRTDYSYFAAALDEIAIRHDVLFVVSAGNLPGIEGRPPWPADADDAVSMLATTPRNEDHITAPGEHLLGLTVGALNPPGVPNHVEYAPTTYTRRGPGAGSARKPELSHFGGARPSASNRTGLFSISDNGSMADDRGTSFAAPLVASTIATLDHSLAGTVPREILLALPVHRASRGAAMTQKALKNIAREFVGFGMPPPAEKCLSDDPYSVSLVFSERLPPRRELDFVFTWPRSLVTPDGKCRGKVDLTLAYTPPIDPQFHAECLRARLGAVLYQLETDPNTGEEKPESRLKMEDSGLPQHLDYTERYLVENGLKWTPITRYHLIMPRGRGSSSEWRLSLKSFTRAGAAYPDEGVPFSLILTISDPAEETPIYDEVRSEITRRGLSLADITVAHRLRV